MTGDARSPHPSDPTRPFDRRATDPEKKAFADKCHRWLSTNRRIYTLYGSVRIPYLSLFKPLLHDPSRSFTLRCEKR